MNYCNACGSNKLGYRIPENDTVARYVCEDCGVIHYQNPKVVVGCLLELKAQVLLCRRAIEPRSGYWTLPAGFLENGESTEQGAIRETREEANAEISGKLTLFTMYSIPFINQVHLFFRAKLRNKNFYPGTESLDVKLFDHSEIPWDEIAFATVSKTLNHYLTSVETENQQVHVGTIRDTRRPSPVSG